MNKPWSIWDKTRVASGAPKTYPQGSLEKKRKKEPGLGARDEAPGVFTGVGAVLGVTLTPFPRLLGF